MLKPMEWSAYIVPLALIIPFFAASAQSQTLPPSSTTIPGIVEPLELRGEPQPLNEPSEVEKRLASISPKGDDPQALRKALQAVDTIVQQYPNSVDALSLRLLLSCDIKSQDFPIRIGDIDTVIQLEKSTSTKDGLISEPELRTMRAKVEYDAGNHRKAVEELFSAISADVDDADNLLNSGGLEPENKSAPCAWYKPDLDQLVREYPSDYRVYLFRGLQYEIFQRFSDASQYAQQPALNFGRAAMLNPRSPLPEYFLGKSYVSKLGVMFGTDPDSLQKRTKALAAYSRAIQIDPHFTPAYVERAELYYETKRYAEAIKDYDKVIKADPKSAGTYNDRALAESALGDSNSAIIDFNSAIENRDSLHELSLKQTYENRADEYVKVKEYDRAVKDYTQTLKMLIGEEAFLMNIRQIKRIYPEYENVSDEALCRKFHDLFFRNMKYEDFAKQFMDPNREDFDTFLIPEVFVKRGNTYLKAGDFRKAVTDYQRGTNGFAYGKKTIDRWHLLSQGPGREVYLDSQNAEISDANTAKFWIKEVDTKQTTRGTYTLEKYAVDCRDERIDMLSFLKYKADGGNAIASSDVEAGWQSIVPDTLGERLYHGMCSQ